MAGPVAGPTRPATRDTWWLAAVGALAVVWLMPLFTAWRMSPDLGHGLALPWLAGWLVWEGWDRRPPFAPRPLGAPVLLLAAGLAAAVPLRLLLEPYPLWPAALWLWFGLGSAVLLALLWAGGGAAVMRRFAFPLLLLATGLPWPSGVEQAVILPLRRVIAFIAADAMNLCGYPALVDGTIIRVSTGAVGVDEACGGMRSLQSSIMVALFLGGLGAGSLGRRALLVLIAIGAAVLGNIGRAVVLTWTAATGGEAKLNAWHDGVGYAALAFTLLLVVLGAWLLGRRGATRRVDAPSAPASAPGRGSRLRAAGVLAAIAAVAFVGLEVFAQRWFAAVPARRAQALEWRVQWPHDAEAPVTTLPALARELLGQPDTYQSTAWRTADNATVLAYLLEWRSGQAARIVPFLHRPDVCLPMTGYEPLGGPERATFVIGGRTLDFESYAFTRGDDRMQLVRLVWDIDEARTLPPPAALGGAVAVWRERWQDVRAHRGAVRVQILALAVAGPFSAEQARAALERELARGLLLRAGPGGV